MRPGAPGPPCLTRHARSLKLLLELVQDLVAGQDLRHTAIGLAAFADGCKKFTVLQFDAVHGHRHLTHIDLLFLAVEQVVVAGNVGARVADVAKESAQRTIVVETQ